MDSIPLCGDRDEGCDRTPGSRPQVLPWVPVPCVVIGREEPEGFARVLENGVYALLPVQEGDVGSTPEFADS